MNLDRPPRTPERQVVCGVDLRGVYRNREDGELYRVVTIAEHPTVCVENVKTGERGHYVIQSPLFRDRFQELVPVEPTRRNP